MKKKIVIALFIAVVFTSTVHADEIATICADEYMTGMSDGAKISIECMTKAVTAMTKGKSDSEREKIVQECVSKMILETVKKRGLLDD